MSANNGQVPILYTTATGVPSSPMQQPAYGSDQKYTYPQQQQQQQQPQQGVGHQQFGGMVTPPATGQPPQFQQQQFQQPQFQQPQFQHMHPGNPGMNQGYYPPVMVVQQQVPMQYPQQQMYGQQFPMSIPIGGLNSGPGLVDCPRCGKRGLTNTSSVAGSTTHLWALLLCFFFCLGCIPYLVSGLQDVEHRCSSCGALVATCGDEIAVRGLYDRHCGG